MTESAPLTDVSLSAGHGTGSGSGSGSAAVAAVASNDTAAQQQQQQQQYGGSKALDEAQSFTLAKMDAGVAVLISGKHSAPAPALVPSTLADDTVLQSLCT